MRVVLNPVPVAHRPRCPQRRCRGALSPSKAPANWDEKRRPLTGIMFRCEACGTSVQMHPRGAR